MKALVRVVLHGLLLVALIPPALLLAALCGMWWLWNWANGSDSRDYWRRH